MAEPSWLAGGDIPHRNDSEWFRWVRICGSTYNSWGADPELKPKPTDTLRRLMDKTERILFNIP